MTSFITLLLPVLVFSRIYGRIITRNQHEYDPMRELRIAYSLNKILCIISKTEELLLRSWYFSSCRGVAALHWEKRTLIWEMKG